MRLHREEGLDFSRVRTFNLDEYRGLGRDHPRSFRRWMEGVLFEHVNLAPESTCIPDGDVEAGELARHCAALERRIAEAGGIDLQLLGLGRNGHIGFNEPGSPRDARTRLVELDALTRADAAADFGSLEAVPTRAVTLGVATILEARRIRVLAFGASKAEVVRRVLRSPVGPEVPATYLRDHPDARLLVDPAAAVGAVT